MTGGMGEGGVMQRSWTNGVAIIAALLLPPTRVLAETSLTNTGSGRLAVTSEPSSTDLVPSVTLSSTTFTGRVVRHSSLLNVHQDGEVTLAEEPLRPLVTAVDKAPASGLSKPMFVLAATVGGAGVGLVFGLEAAALSQRGGKSLVSNEDRRKFVRDTVLVGAGAGFVISLLACPFID